MELYFEDVVEGTRRFILKESIEDIPKSTVHLKIFKFIHYAMKFSTVALIICLIYIIYDTFGNK